MYMCYNCVDRSVVSTTTTRTSTTRKPKQVATSKSQTSRTTTKKTTTKTAKATTTKRPTTTSSSKPSSTTTALANNNRRSFRSKDKNPLTDQSIYKQLCPSLYFFSCFSHFKTFSLSSFLFFACTHCKFSTKISLLLNILT